MNDTQRAKLAMLQATLAVLDQHAALYATNQALGKAHDELAAFGDHAEPDASIRALAALVERLDRLGTDRGMGVAADAAGQQV